MSSHTVSVVELEACTGFGSPLFLQYERPPLSPPKDLNRIMSSKQGELQRGRRGGVQLELRVHKRWRGVSMATESSCLSHMTRVSLENSEKRFGARALVHVLDTNGSNMSADQQDRALAANGLRLNGSAALGLQDEEMNTALFEFRVSNIVIIALALCILTITGLYCITVCYNRTRQSKRAHIYESAVTGDESLDPVAVKAVKRSTSFLNPLTFFRKPEAAKDNSKIYYIYSNPLPVGERENEDEERGSKTRWEPEEQSALTPPLSFKEYANDPDSGVTLDPPIFYMQL
ncbi:uncharacterized protein si:dkey-246e1.3 [Mugil cephalus]|uniref:uncharacterized protein si:dkey-246e1.3 n=1 Tax=Mugil cephalus TaxID=48193 RepID=UPI001FB7AD0C|nr:uncharacterized protein si:dkey-246e1.3 [Mugil cephalus]